MDTVSRRHFVQTSVGAAALGAPALFAQTAQTEGLSIALASRAPVTLNPFQAGRTGGDSWGIFQVFDTLVASPNGSFAITPEEFKPQLAESWTRSPDAKTWSYKLRRGVQFHKGFGEMTSDDVVFTFGRHLDPKIVTASKQVFSNIESVVASGTHGVVIQLKRPDPLFNAGAVALAHIVSRKAFEQLGNGFATAPVGTGPYQADAFSATDGVRLSAFAGHFAGPAATKNLHVRFIADTTARTLAFASGQVDMIEGVRAPGWIPSMKQRAPKTIFDATGPGSFNLLHLNLNRPPLNDLRVRQAIRLAINSDQLAAAYQGLAVPMVGIIAPQFAGSVKMKDLPPELQYKHDVKRAKALLAEAGHPNGITLPCFTSQREDFATIMLMLQEQLRAAGIQLDLKIIDHATMHAENRKDRNNVSLYSLSFPPVPTQPFQLLLARGAEVKADGTGGDNFSHYGVAMPGLDTLIERAQDEPDFNKRVALVQFLERQVLRDLPLLGICTLSYVIARNPRVDLGYAVKSGPAYWRLDKARRV